jgi:hypothetical protein
MNDIDTGFLSTQYGMFEIIAVVIAAVVVIALLSIFVVPKAVEAIRAWKGRGDDGKKDASQDEKLDAITSTLDEIAPIVKNNAKDVLRINSKLRENSPEVRCISACRYLENGGNGKTAVEYADDVRAGKWDGCESLPRLKKLLGL